MNDWEKRYQAGQTGWDRGGVSSALGVWFSDGASTPMRVLVPGCGRGYEVVALAKHGYAVTAIDIAPSAVQDLKAALQREALHAEVILGDLFEFQPEQPFDAIYEQTCLCAIDPTQRRRYAGLLYQWLKPGGRLFALFMQTGRPDGPPFHCDVLDMHRLFDDRQWLWPECAPLFIPQHHGRFELGYQLIRQ